MAEESKRPVFTQEEKFKILRCDRDRNFAVPPSVFFRFCMELRFASNREAVFDLLGGKYVVRAQMIRFMERLPHEMSTVPITIAQSIGHVGNSSFEFLYTIYDDRKEETGRVIATVTVVCVAVSDPGQKMELPAAFREVAASHQTHLDAPSGTADRDVAAALLSELNHFGGGRSPQPVDDENLASADIVPPEDDATEVTRRVSMVRSDDLEYFIMPILLRPSDEDGNHHVNNTSYVRFFEDALEIVRELAHVPFGARDIQMIAIDYLREANINTARCRVLCQLQQPPNERAIEDGSSHAVSGTCPSLALLLQGQEPDGKTYIYARARIVSTFD